MSVYTNLENKDVKKIVSQYDIGILKSYKGISDGITNTNYFLNTSKGKYVITIFEDIKKAKVIKYLKLMNYFSEKGLCSPEIMLTKKSEILTNVNDKPCSIMQRLEGKTVEKTNKELCESLGSTIGQFHTNAGMYKINIRNSRDIKWIHKSIQRVSKHIKPNQLKLLIKSSKVFEKLFNSNLPSGVIHSDLFRDNVLARKNNVTGIIDYYYSFTGPLIYELAVVINDWCVNKDGSVNDIKRRALLGGYNLGREITVYENKQLNNAMIAASLRFYLSRLVDMIFPKVGAITHIKDPSIFENILINRLKFK